MVLVFQSIPFRPCSSYTNFDSCYHSPEDHDNNKDAVPKFHDPNNIRGYCAKREVCRSYLETYLSGCTRLSLIQFHQTKPRPNRMRMSTSMIQNAARDVTSGNPVSILTTRGFYVILWKGGRHVQRMCLLLSPTQTDARISWLLDGWNHLRHACMRLTVTLGKYFGITQKPSALFPKLRDHSTVPKKNLIPWSPKLMQKYILKDLGSAAKKSLWTSSLQMFPSKRCLWLD